MADTNDMAQWQRADGSLDTAKIIDAYLNLTTELRDSVAGLTHEQLLSRPIPGKWSTLEVVCHVADTEIYLTDRIERTLALEHPLLMGVDERPYPARLNYQAFDIQEQLDLFSALHKHAGRILRLQPDEAWKRTAVHSEAGLQTLQQLVLKTINHTRHHLKFIAVKRAVL